MVKEDETWMIKSPGRICITGYVYELFSCISHAFIDCPLFARSFAKYLAHEKDMHSVNNVGYLFALSLNDFFF